MNREALCTLIREAFAGVRLGEGVGLRQAQGLDDYADAQTCAQYRADDEQDDWQRLTPEALNACYSSLSFFDAAGMRFHLPAFLVAEIQGLYLQDLVFQLAHLNDYSRAQYALLSSAQRQAVRAYLLQLLDDERCAFDRPHILRALEEYWTDDAPGSASPGGSPARD